MLRQNQTLRPHWTVNIRLRKAWPFHLLCFPATLPLLFILFSYFLCLQDAFTVAFVRHYSKITRVLSWTNDRTTVANRVVHISVQLFSNESLATRMVKERQVLRSVIDSLSYLLTPILVPSNILGKSPTSLTPILVPSNIQGKAPKSLTLILVTSNILGK